MIKYVREDEIRDRLEGMGVRGEPRKRICVVGGRVSGKKGAVVGSVGRVTRARWADVETDSADHGGDLGDWWRRGCLVQERGSVRGQADEVRGRSRWTSWRDEVGGRSR